jgi:hypothetical protein
MLLLLLLLLRRRLSMDGAVAVLCGSYQACSHVPADELGCNQLPAQDIPTEVGVAAATAAQEVQDVQHPICAQLRQHLPGLQVPLRARSCCTVVICELEPCWCGCKEAG